MTVERMENDEKLQDLSLSVFHATTHSFPGTDAVKIVESHMARAYIKHRPKLAVQLGVTPPQQILQPVQRSAQIVLAPTQFPL